MQEKFSNSEKNFSINSKIKKVREVLKLSQDEFSSNLDTSISAISRIESGETKHISHHILLKLLKVYNVNIDYLLDNSEKMFDVAEYEKLKENSERYNNLVKEKSQEYTDYTDLEKDKELIILKAKNDLLMELFNKKQKGEL